jgi:hypothetical protein
MEMVYFFYPKNFTIKGIYKLEHLVATEVDEMPPVGTPRIVLYVLGGRVHTYLGEDWPPKRHTLRPPLRRAVIKTTGRDVTAEMLKIDGPPWLTGVTWTPLRPRFVWSLSPFRLELKIFRKFFLEEEGPVSVHFWGQVEPDLSQVCDAIPEHDGHLVVA